MPAGVRLPDAAERIDVLVRERAIPELPAGMVVHTRKDGTPRVGAGFAMVDTDRATLDAWIAAGHVAWPDRPIDLGPAPTLPTSALVGADALRGATGELDGVRLDGSGVRVGNIDTHIEVTHPHFFRPDAGTFDWVDVGGDGELTPGVDGIDLDGDGSIAADEVLHELDGWTWRYDGITEQYVSEEGPGVLDPSVDWLYLDVDGDGQRDAGRPEWRDDDPGMSEPTFVPDDVDGDGAITRTERLWQLGSSRIAAVYWDGEIYGPDDLTRYDNRTDGSDRFHGTGVSGIVMGGQLPDQRRFRGLAPEAELVFISRQNVQSLGGLLDFIDAAEELEVDVLLHEYAPWLGFSLDGTDPVEQVVDALAEDGMVQVCAAGNLADAGKHGQLAPNPGVPGWSTSIEVLDERSVLYVEWHSAVSDGPIACSLSIRPDDEGVPERTIHTVSDPVGGIDWSESPEFSWVVDIQDSEGGNRRTNLVVWDPAYAGRLPSGTWALSCDIDAPLDVYLSDGSGWGRGSTFKDEIRAATMGLPSTAEHCVAVGAYAGQFESDVPVGELHGWSSRGPALGGQKSIDIAAPDDAWTPSPVYDPLYGGAYTLFSGTSGAAPHVTAVAALMKQHDPELTGIEVRQRLMETALEDSAVTPGDGWGAGKVAGYRAILDSPRPEVVVPDAPVELSFVRDPGLPGVIHVAAPGATEVRWDVGYDGTIDGSGPVWTVQPGAPTRITAYAGATRIGGRVIPAGQFVDPDSVERPGACAVSPASGVGGMLLALGLLGLRRR